MRIRLPLCGKLKKRIDLSFILLDVEGKDEGITQLLKAT